jgi:hypothetical protein
LLGPFHAASFAIGLDARGNCQRVAMDDVPLPMFRQVE